MEKKFKNNMKSRKTCKNEIGITLIALVVTIVVLLILAGVSLSLVLGENGLIGKAKEAKEKTEISEEKEKVEISAVSAALKDKWGKITEDNLRTELDTNIGGEKYTLAPNGEKFIVTYKDSNRSYEVNKSGNVTGLKPREEGIPGNRYDEDTDITIGGEKVTIPGGATISKIPGEYESIDDGLVIYIVPKDEIPDWTADTNSNGIKDVQEKYDQFVWIPVKNAVLDLSTNTEALVSDDSIEAEIQKEIDRGRFPMAIKKDATNYFGVLYEFEDATDEEGNNYVKVTPYNNSKYDVHREPEIVLGDNVYLEQINGILNTNYSNSADLKTDLQVDFNYMITRVASKGGFWVGRYETSSMVDSNTQDTTNRVTVIRGTTTGAKIVHLAD